MINPVFDLLDMHDNRRIVISYARVTVDDDEKILTRLTPAQTFFHKFWHRSRNTLSVVGITGISDKKAAKDYHLIRK